MKCTRLLVGCGMMTIGAMNAYGLGNEGGQDAGKPPVEVLLEQLKDERYEVRQKATQALWEMGDKILPSLEIAKKSDDPEVLRRVQDLERKIKLAIRPDTSKKVIDLIMRYDSASVEEKRDILRKLVEEKAWYQVLKIYSMKDNPEVRRYMPFSIDAIAVRGGRELMNKGQDQAALELLMLAPDPNQKWIAIGEWYRVHGLIDQELLKSREDKSQLGIRKTIGLLRVKGEWAEAAKLAKQIGDDGISSMMYLLSGDPRPWLRSNGVRANWFGNQMHWNRGEGDDDGVGGGGGTVPSDNCLNGMVRRWSGEKIPQEEMDEMIKRAKSPNKAISSPAIEELIAIGQFHLAIDLYGQSHPMDAFLYLDGLEEVDRAMRMLGADQNGKGVEILVNKLFKKYLINEEEQFGQGESESTDMVKIACFLEHRGMGELAWEVYAPLMKQLSEKKLVNFFDVVGKLMRGQAETMRNQADELGVRLLKEWIGGNEDRYQEAVEGVFNEDADVKEIWELVVKSGKGMSKEQCFRGLLALKSIGKVDEKNRIEWLQRVWQEVDARVADDQIQALKALMTLGMSMGDVQTTLKAWQQIPRNRQGDLEWTQIIFHLSAVGRWQECYELLHGKMDQLVKMETAQSPAIYAYVASVLRKLGKEHEAKEYDQKVERLVLGDTEAAVLASQGYEFGMDYQRSIEWGKRAACFAQPGTYDYSRVFEIYEEQLVEQGKWAELASVCEYVIAKGMTEYSVDPKVMQCLQTRLKGDIARGLSKLQENRASGLAFLGQVHRDHSKNGILADLFFPNLRDAGVSKEYDEWFQKSWKELKQSRDAFPKSDQTKNTMAWMAARAQRELDEAETMMKSVVANSPRNGAYLDTLAEVYSAKGDKKKALEISDQAIRNMPLDRGLIRQHAKFLREGAKP